MERYRIVNIALYEKYTKVVIRKTLLPRQLMQWAAAAAAAVRGTNCIRAMSSVVSIDAAALGPNETF